MVGMDIAAVMAQMRQDFIDGCQDKVEALNATLSDVVGGVQDETKSNEFRRLVHSLKGLGGTFGFPAITHVAHRLEDYLEIAGHLDSANVDKVQAYVDAIEAIIDSGENPSEAETERMLRALPQGQVAGFTGQKAIAVAALVVMPQGIWRKMVGQELASCGFRVGFSENGQAALAGALATPPDMVFAAMELEDMTGVELAGVFQAVARTRGARFAIVTSRESLRVPEGVLVVRKSKEFAENLAEALMTWKMA